MITAERSSMRELMFVRLFASAKQLIDNHPRRFPYLEYDVLEIERLGLAPKLVEDDKCLLTREQTKAL